MTIYKPVEQIEQEALTRIERLYADAETFRFLKQRRALRRQRVATLLHKLAEYLDPPLTMSAPKSRRRQQ